MHSLKRILSSIVGSTATIKSSGTSSSSSSRLTDIPNSQYQYHHYHHQKHTPLYFIIMRLNLKVVLVLLCLAVFLFTLTIWTHCGDLALARGFLPKWDRRFNDENQEAIVNVDCIINQEYSVSCIQDGDEVYVPFSFIRDYFEVYGSLSTIGKGAPKFEWSHSNAKINYPKGTYDPKGIFMYFENYNVEVRDRVKCISASDGVPISTQWEAQGYYYPTQIAQFGLSHYSKNLTDPEPRRKVIEDGDENRSIWIVPRGSNFSRVHETKASHNHIISFATQIHYDSSVEMHLDHVLDLVLSIDIELQSNSSFTVTIQNRETKQLFNVHYVVSDALLTIADESNFYYGIGAINAGIWKHLTRDLVVDLQKGIQHIPATSVSNNFGGGGGAVGFTSNVDKIKKKLRRSDIKVTSISLFGIGKFDNLTFSTTEHLTQFYDAAEWFVRNQNTKTGGWPNPVKRKLSEFAELKQGWYSAMGQGHAISLLARAYYHSNGDSKYLKAAINGLKPFRIPSRQGGVLAKFMGKYDWYEEYPTTPASFVLNGFIYSLLGLYDLNATAPLNLSREAAILFDQGMISLKKMLLMYDTGSGSVYDLRHITLGLEPNIARWDYHATHVNQLLLLATIDRDPLISRVADRWRRYMLGKRAPHN
ncbi:D-glucuronyl C5-epimerase B [Contarinia nasturtii]|uniref:D-glucuronyl C5-epimerase B n=1 Tax=Contarinia nasturtii TaxID=265458 RepID=UPI0012D3771C|nr:D-glucuronyl C5-epimerase B [Contarinia nasturtii]